MRCLAIDTSTPTVVTGIVDSVDGSTAAVVTVENCRDHNERLVPSIKECLATSGCGFADLDAVVVGCGPGPFTGLRVGMATAAAVADARSIPVYGVVSLDAIAVQIEVPRVLVATDARRREVYWAAYENGHRVGEPGVCPPADLPLDGVDVLAIPRHIDVEWEGARVDLHPTPATLVAVADMGRDPAPLVPLYLRRPDAVEPTPPPPSPVIPQLPEELSVETSTLGWQGLRQ